MKAEVKPVLLDYQMQSHLLRASRQAVMMDSLLGLDISCMTLIRRQGHVLACADTDVA